MECYTDKVVQGNIDCELSVSYFHPPCREAYLAFTQALLKVIAGLLSRTLEDK